MKLNETILHSKKKTQFHLVQRIGKEQLRQCRHIALRTKNKIDFGWFIHRLRISVRKQKKRERETKISLSNVNKLGTGNGFLFIFGIFISEGHYIYNTNECAADGDCSRL